MTAEGHAMANRPRTAGKSIVPPRLPKTFDRAALPDGTLYSGEMYESCAVSHEDLTNQVADQVTFDAVRLSNVTLRNTELTTLRLKDVRFDACDLANAQWYKAVFHRVELVGCRMVGFKAGEAQLHNTLLRDCQAKLANFRFATFKAVRFEHCDLVDTAFQGADLSGAIFADCDLTNAEMVGVKLVGTDLRGSKLDGVKIGPDDLRGAVVDPAQAVALIRLLGVVVAPQDVG